MSATTTKVPNNTKKKTTQKFIRINLDDKLDQILCEYELKYSLLSRSDIIRMILSEQFWQKKLQKHDPLQNLINELKELHKDTLEISEDEVFKILKQNDLM